MATKRTPAGRAAQQWLDAETPFSRPQDALAETMTREDAVEIQGYQFDIASADTVSDLDRIAVELRGKRPVVKAALRREWNERRDELRGMIDTTVEDAIDDAERLAKARVIDARLRQLSQFATTWDEDRVAAMADDEFSVFLTARTAEFEAKKVADAQAIKLRQEQEAKELEERIAARVKRDAGVAAADREAPTGNQMRSITEPFPDTHSEPVIIWPAQCDCGHQFLERYQFSEVLPSGFIGFAWCGFCRTKRMVKPFEHPIVKPTKET